MKKFYVTFGQKYRREAHPLQPWVHPDGWLLVCADDEDTARAAAVSCVGQFFSNIYTHAEFKGDRDLYPKGELNRIDA